MKRVSARELLDLRERLWSGRLGGVSLVAEVETKPGHAEQVAKVLGSLYRARIDAGRAPALIFEKWPACTAVAIAWIAAERYEKGTFWRYLWDAVRYDGHVDDQYHWGQGFLDALRQLGCPLSLGCPCVSSGRSSCIRGFRRTAWTTISGWSATSGTSRPAWTPNRS